LLVETTRLSSKGQVIIPQAIREAHQWASGVEFVVIDTDQGILLTPLSPFKATSIEEVLGCAGYKGKKKSIKDMEKGIIKGARKHK
jgi:AbrB family looped-hinge helix DNA binding protein